MTKNYDFKEVEKNFGFITIAYMVTLVLYYKVSLYKMSSVLAEVWSVLHTFQISSETSHVEMYWSGMTKWVWNVLHTYGSNVVYHTVSSFRQAWQQAVVFPSHLCLMQHGVTPCMVTGKVWYMVWNVLYTIEIYVYWIHVGIRLYMVTLRTHTSMRSFPFRSPMWPKHLESKYT